MPLVKKKINKKTSTKKTSKKKKRKISLLKVLEVFSVIFLIAVFAYTLSPSKKNSTKQPSGTTEREHKKTGKNVTKEIISPSKTYVLHKVNGGDSLIIKDDKDNMLEVSLYGIYAPEPDQKYGKEAKNYLQKITTGKKLRAIQKDSDPRNGNTVILQEVNYEQPEELSINQKMIQAGYAWVYNDYCSDEQCVTWKIEERLAISRNIGLWNQSSPTAPWKHRQFSKKNN